MRPVNPEKDNRYRVSKSVSIYVAFSNIYSGETENLHFSIVDSCERVVFGIKGKEGEYIRFQNNAYKLYPPESLIEIINRAKNSELNLVHYSGVSSASHPSSLKNLSPAHFCILGASEGHFFRF